jgi:hypothetical protein
MAERSGDTIFAPPANRPQSQVSPPSESGVALDASRYSPERETAPHAIEDECALIREATLVKAACGAEQLHSARAHLGTDFPSQPGHRGTSARLPAIGDDAVRRKLRGQLLQTLWSPDALVRVSASAKPPRV